MKLLSISCPHCNQRFDIKQPDIYIHFNTRELNDGEPYTEQIKTECVKCSKKICVVLEVEVTFEVISVNKRQFRLC